MFLLPKRKPAFFVLRFVPFIKRRNGEFYEKNGNNYCGYGVVVGYAG